MKNFESIENIEQQVLVKLENARLHSLPYEEVTNITDRVIELESFGGHKEEIKELEARLSPSIVTVYTLPEFKLLLEKTDIDSAAALDALAHENAHANVAESLGGKDISYNLLVAKGKNNWRYDLWVSSGNSDSWSEREKVINQMRIFNAPEEYGNSPSDDDRQTVKKLKEKLVELDKITEN